MIIDSLTLNATAASQDGLVTLAQVHQVGFDRRGIRAMLDTGRWQQPLPKVFLTSPANLTLDQKRTAAGLYTTGIGHLSGLAALQWHAIPDLPSYRRLLILVPHSVRRASYSFVETQRSRRFDPNAKDAGTYHVCTVARATADACRRARPPSQPP